MKAKVFEFIDLELPEPTPNDPWFLDWVLRSPKQAGIHLTAGFHVYNDVYRQIGPVNSATEYFGGIGAQAFLIEKLFSPALSHVVQDYSYAAAQHLDRALPRHVNTGRADSYDSTNFAPAELVGLDFGDLTAWKTREGEKHRALLDRVFSAEPKAVVFTDVACRYLHLHRERYETLLGTGTCDTYESYLYALLGRMEELYGYHLLAGYMHTWSTVMALVPRPVDGVLLPTPDSPKGIQLA